jgi:hypothetical protein
MQQISPLIVPALFVLAGVLLVIFRRQTASHIIEKNRALYDRVPTFFPPPEADRDRLRLLFHQWLVAVIGLVWIVAGAAIIVESMR